MRAQDDCMEEAHGGPTLAGEAHESRYAAYLLRVWHNDASGEWRLVVEEVGSEARHGFTDWDALVNHLRNCALDSAQRK